MKGDVSIKLENVCVDFPVFHAGTLSLKNKILNSITGGLFHRSDDGQVIVQGLHDINIELNSGERIGLLGHNGSGKTTMLRVLSGIYHPTTGQASINGDCVSLINIGLGIDPEATGLENIKLRSVMMGCSPKELKNKVDEIIDFSGLGDFIHLPFRTYSSGMQLRLAFAVSTTVCPQILIMDEWLSLGDAEFSQRAEKRMKSLLSQTEILILASHSREMLTSICTRLIWLDHGRIKMDGPTNEIAHAYFG